MNQTQRSVARYLVRRGPSVAVAIMVSLLVSACAVSENRLQAFADYDPGVSFNGYDSFTWQTPEPIFVATPRPLAPATRKVLMAETVTQLKAKGLRETDAAGDADLLVAIIIGTRDNAHINSYPGRYGGGYSEVRETTTAGIGIELSDRKTGQRLWSGWGTTGLTMDVYANSASVAKQVVVMIMEQFPPPPGA